MLITYYGHSCFKIQTKPKRGDQDVTIYLDPFDKSVGLKPPQGKADIVLSSHSHSDHSNTQGLREGFFLVDAPGEYTLQGISIIGLESFHDDQKGALRGRNTIFIIESEGMRVCHLGDLGHPLSEEQVEEIGDIDILMIPVGGTYTIDAQTAQKISAHIEPSVIIPMHYKMKDSTIDVADEKEFLSLFGAEGKQVETKLNLKKKDTDEKENHIILMGIE
ncbi:MAG TPA: MBL fold metallo-hydrolase [Candidatus Moranbacteria bacterium]|nr:MBL fold metallo-hydrolase [Candidatus Moranbacteria bacterium]